MSISVVNTHHSTVSFGGLFLGPGDSVSIPNISPEVSALIGNGILQLGTVRDIPVINTATLPHTDKSSTAGTTSVTLMAANASRKGWTIKNTSASDMWLNDTGVPATAGGSGSFLLKAGCIYQSPTGHCSKNGIAVLGTNTSLSHTSAEY